MKLSTVAHAGARSRCPVVMLGLLLSMPVLLAAPLPAAASQYNDTNPANTPCGNGTRTVQTWRSYYALDGNNKAVARLDIRYSPYCDTLWVRGLNVTGSGSGFRSPEQSLTIDTTVWVYTCPYSNCFVDSDTQTDVTPNKGDSGFTFQFDVPSSSTRGGPPAAKQPPTVRGKITAHVSGGSAFSIDTGYEPLWDWLNSDYPWHNEPYWRDGDGNPTITCDNTGGYTGTTCKRWAMPGGNPRTVVYRLDPSLFTALHESGVDIVANLENKILPGWSNAGGDSPNIDYCEGLGNPNCQYQVNVFLDNIGGGLSDTAVDTSTVPYTIIYGWSKADEHAVWNNSCGSEGDGCALTSYFDAQGRLHEEWRTLISHEIGHTLGLQHCDLDYGIICHRAAKVINGVVNQQAEGNHAYWTPHFRDTLALETIYP